ncbi:MAP65/ASE1 family protein [Pleurotus pulmonarius]
MASLTALLDSLHTHLQTQTRILPTLHAQLGLPPSALQDELNALKDHLIQSVESQVEGRRKEVEDWMAKCDGVEAECLKYCKSLGGNIKATGTTLGELRKEQVLPRRFELVSEHQEKLRQLYHTKLEQLTTLTNRINSLMRTLGATFYTTDVLSINDEPPVDVTPERFLKLEKELVRGKAEVSKRLSQLCETFAQIDWLYTELGLIPPSPEDHSVASSSNSDPFLSASTSTPTPASRSRAGSLLFAAPDDDGEYLAILSRFISVSAGCDSTPSPSVGLDGVEPTLSLLSWANNLLSSLSENKRRRESHIQAMYDQLEVLWRRLGVAEEDMDAFVEVNRGSTDECVRAYEEELERMLDVKRERMGEFVANAREEIWKLWEDIMVGEEERRDFSPFADDEFSEELLSIHEAEIQRLKEERRQKAPLLASIKKYFEICEEEKELAAAASDQSRLLGRGTGGSRDPGRLLREEKMRRRVKKEKPRLEQDLLASIPSWELENGRPFLVHGESVLQILMETVSAADQENAAKKNKMSHSRSGSGSNSNHGASIARAKTPSGTSSNRGIVTPAVRSASSMSNGRPESSNKRPKLNENGRTPAVGASGSRMPMPLQDHRGQSRTASKSGRSVSPTKIPGKSSLPRQAPPALAMPVPRVGTQHHSLGHGRVPSGHPDTASRSTSGYSAGRSTSITYANSQAQRYGSGMPSEAMGQKVQKLRRESFKPRPSADVLDIPGGQVLKNWVRGTLASSGCVKEEDEGY